MFIESFYGLLYYDICYSVFPILAHQLINLSMYLSSKLWSICTSVWMNIILFLTKDVPISVKLMIQLLKYYNKFKLSLYISAATIFDL